MLILTRIPGRSHGSSSVVAFVSLDRLLLLADCDCSRRRCLARVSSSRIVSIADLRFSGARSSRSPGRTCCPADEESSGFLSTPLADDDDAEEEAEAEATPKRFVSESAKALEAILVGGFNSELLVEVENAAEALVEKVADEEQDADELSSRAAQLSEASCGSLFRGKESEAPSPRARSEFGTTEVVVELAGETEEE